MFRSDSDCQPKILEIGPIPPPHAGWGVRIDYLRAALQKAGIECAALDLGPNRRLRRPHCESVRSGIDYAWKVIRYVRRGYIIHNHLNGESAKAALLVLYASIIGRIFGSPAVLTWHGGLGYRWFPHTRNRLMKLIYKTIFRLSGPIVCNDDKVKSSLVDYGAPASRVFPIPAFSTHYLNFEPVSLPAAIEEFIGSHDPYLFCYTLYREEFYLPVLVDALERIVADHPRAGLLLVGDSTGSESTRDAIAARGLASHVCFAGDFTRNEFLTALSRATVCIRTHQRDGISSSVLEALTLGVPVVAAANELRPTQVATYRADDAAALAAVVLRVLALPDDARRPRQPENRDTISDEIDVLLGRYPQTVAAGV